MRKREHEVGELRDLLEERLIAKYGALDNVPNTPDVRVVIRETARDYFAMVEAQRAKPAIRVQLSVVGGDNVIRVQAFELRAPKPPRATRRLVKKRCRVVDLTAWRLARGR